jgi:hypothetical protein
MQLKRPERDSGAIPSLGCIGKRVYTGLADDEMYFVLRGRDVFAVAESLAIVTSANAALNEYATGRRSQLQHYSSLRAKLYRARMKARKSPADGEPSRGA